MLNCISKTWYAKGVSFGSPDFRSKTSQVYHWASVDCFLLKVIFFSLKFPDELTPCEQKF